MLVVKVRKCMCFNYYMVIFESILRMPHIYCILWSFYISVFADNGVV